MEVTIESDFYVIEIAIQADGFKVYVFIVFSLL